MPQIHIGHHFYGSGNIGDDWMIAGFLRAFEAAGQTSRITCCIPAGHRAMRARFPRIEWLDYSQTERARAISEATVWLGLGDTPFQIDSGPWLLDHLLEDLAFCRNFGTPVYFLGVGVERPEVMQAPHIARILRQTHHIWTRDTPSAEQLAKATQFGTSVTAGADLAHIYFESLITPRSDPRTTRVGMVVNVENSSQLDFAALSGFIVHSNPQPFRWIAQDVRSFPVSEMHLWEKFGPTIRKGMELAVPDYQHGALDSFLSIYNDLSVLLSTRYHSALAAAWRGLPISVYARSRKLDNLIDQLAANRCESLAEKALIARGIACARPIPRANLEALAATAYKNCREFFEYAFHHPGMPHGGRRSAAPSGPELEANRATVFEREVEAIERDYIERGRTIQQYSRRLGLLESEFDVRLNELTKLYSATEVLNNERNLLQAQLANLQRNFAAVEADRLARGKVIQEQGQAQARLHQEIDLRLKELHQLQISTESLRNERNLLQAQLADLRSNFDAAEKDRIARGAAIEDQGAVIAQLHSTVDTYLKELTALQQAAETLRNERNLIQAQLADLRSNFDAAEKDRIARGAVIEDQGRRAQELHRLIWLTEQNRDWWRNEANRRAAEAAARSEALAVRISTILCESERYRTEVDALRRELGTTRSALDCVRSHWWHRLGVFLNLR